MIRIETLLRCELEDPLRRYKRDSLFGNDFLIGGLSLMLNLSLNESLKKKILRINLFFQFATSRLDI